MTAVSTKASLNNAVRTGVEGGDVRSTITDYVSRYDADSGATAASRKSDYATLVNSYYDLVTDFYEHGWGHSFHFAARRRGESFEASIRRHEHFLAMHLGASRGSKVIDVGCGVGGPMRAIAHFTGANIVGINNNAYQIERGEAHNRKAGLAGRCSFVKCDFMQMTLEDDSIDGAYAIEATCHAPNPLGVYSEIHRVLKPGSTFVGYEWCVTDLYRSDDENHRRVIHGIEEGDALPELRTTKQVDRALTDAGFEIEKQRDLVDDCDPETPWYLPLTGRSLRLKDIPRTRYGRAVTRRAVRLMETLKIAPPGASDVSAMLNAAADNLVLGGQMRIFTPMYFFVARKR